MSDAEKNTDALRKKLGWAADRLDELAEKLTEEAGEMRDKLVDRLGGEDEVKERVDELKEDVGEALDELKEGLGKFVKRFRQEAAGGAAAPDVEGQEAAGEAAGGDAGTTEAGTDGATGEDADASEGGDTDARGGGGGGAMP